MPPVYISAFTSFTLQDTKRGISALRDGVYRFIRERPALSGEIVFANTKIKVNVRNIQPASPSTLESFPIFSTKEHDRNIHYVEDPRICDKEFTGLPLRLEGHKRQPVVRFQANIMKDGIILATTFFHPAIDGSSLFEILTTLATSIREPGLLSKDYALQELRAPQHLARIIKEPGPAFQNNQLSKSADIPEYPASLQLSLCTKRLLEMASRCQDHIKQRIGSAGTCKISSGDVESATIWLCIVRARIKAALSSADNISTARQSSLAAAMNVRQPIIPDMPQSYMGNAVVFATASSSVPPMLETTGDKWVRILTDLAIKVHRARRGISKEYVEGSFSNINDAKDWGEFVFAIPEVLVSNMRHMKVYDLDFGSVLGTVDTFKIHNAGIKGGCWIMSDRKGMSENVLKREFIVEIEPDAMAHLDKDPLLHWLSGGNSSKL